MRWNHVRTMLAARAERVTQAGLARELDVPRSTLHRWLKGEQEPQGAARAMLFQWADGQQAEAAEPPPRTRAVIEGQSIELEALMAYVLERQRRLTAHIRASDPALAPAVETGR